MRLGKTVRTFYVKQSAMPFDVDMEGHRLPPWLPVWLRCFYRIKSNFGTDPVVGWRVWRGGWDPTERDWLLHSLTARHRWLTGVVRNSTRPCPELGRYGPAIGGGGSPGFFALKTQLRAHEILPHAPFVEDWFWVLGAVEMSGHVVEHELGYRAQCMRIKHLELSIGTSIPSATKEVLCSLQSRYCCDVHCLIDRDVSAEETELWNDALTTKFPWLGKSKGKWLGTVVGQLAHVSAESPCAPRKRSQNRVM